MEEFCRIFFGRRPRSAPLSPGVWQSAADTKPAAREYSRSKNTVAHFSCFVNHFSNVSAQIPLDAPKEPLIESAHTSWRHLSVWTA